MTTDHYEVFDIYSLPSTCLSQVKAGSLECEVWIFDDSWGDAEDWKRSIRSVFDHHAKNNLVIKKMRLCHLGHEFRQSECQDVIKDFKDKFENTPCQVELHNILFNDLWSCSPKSVVKEFYLRHMLQHLCLVGGEAAESLICLMMGDQISIDTPVYQLSSLIQRYSSVVKMFHEEEKKKNEAGDDQKTGFCLIC